MRRSEAKQKKRIFLPEEVFFLLTCPLMGDPYPFPTLSIFVEKIKFVDFYD